MTLMEREANASGTDGESNDGKVVAEATRLNAPCSAARSMASQRKEPTHLACAVRRYTYEGVFNFSYLFVALSTHAYLPQSRVLSNFLCFPATSRPMAFADSPPTANLVAAPSTEGSTSATTSLVQHLLGQSAPRAAARLSTTRDARTNEPERALAFRVAASAIMLVDSEAAVHDFTSAVHDLRVSDITVAIDLEWRPDILRPSLLQLATRQVCWLLDLESAACCSAAPLNAVSALLASRRVLGFGLHGDLDRLQLVYPASHPPLVASRVCDLRSACLAAAQPSAKGGLAVQLKAWTGHSLDKAMQCSDWRRRPLTAAQIAYAAADAMSLHWLDESIAHWAQLGHVADPRSECELRARPARTLSSGKPTEEPTAMVGAAVDALLDESSARVRAAIDQIDAVGAPSSCWLAHADDAPSDDAVEINALAFHGGAQLGPLLVLTPAAAPKVDMRWLALALGCPRRKLRMVTEDECMHDFGAVPGHVPPIALRRGVRVLCDPRLADAPRLFGSCGDASLRVVLNAPRTTLPALTTAAATACDESDAGASIAAAARTCMVTGAPHAPVLAADGPDAARMSATSFVWLPSPECWHASLDDALEALHVSPPPIGPCTTTVRQPPAAVKLIVDPTLSVLARKLRLIGLDCRVAGEVLRAPETRGTVGDAKRGSSRSVGLVGLLRVGIDGGMVEAHLRCAALEGRLLLTTSRRAKQPAPGPTYRLLETTDAAKQLAEVLTLLQIGREIESAGSRCGICNGDAWQVLCQNEVEGGHVPRSILRHQAIFYRCSVCAQIFWPRSARAAAHAHGSTSGADPAAAVGFRPSSQIVMAIGANSNSGQMLREARALHSTLRRQLEEPETVRCAVYWY